MEENLRNYRRAASSPYLESCYMCSKAGFAVNCVRPRQGTGLRRYSLCGLCVEVVAKNRVTSLLREVDRMTKPLHCI